MPLKHVRASFGVEPKILSLRVQHNVRKSSVTQISGRNFFISNWQFQKKIPNHFGFDFDSNLDSEVNIFNRSPMHFFAEVLAKPSMRNLGKCLSDFCRQTP